MTAFALAVSLASPALPAAATVAVYGVEDVRGSEAVVDFGEPDLPDGGAPPSVTLIGRDGWSKGRLSRAEDRCEYLCGEGNEEGRECHKVGVYALDRAVARPAVAIAGEHSVAGFRAIALAATHEDPAGVIDGWVSGAFQATATVGADRWRWSRAGVGRGFDLESEYNSGGDYWTARAPIRNVPLGDCAIRRYEDLTNLLCETGASWLYRGAEPLLVNHQDDYSGTPRIDLVSRFSLDGATYYVVQLESKERWLRTGVLEHKSGKWRFHPAPKNYALIC